MAAPAPHSQREIRRRNLARVLHTVSAHGPVSRATVATRIGLTRAAVSTLVDELLRVGLLTEQGPGRSGAVGRPGTALALSDQGPCGVGAEIGVDHLAVCAVDLRGQVRARISAEAENRDSEPRAVLLQLARLLGRLALETRALRLRPAGLTLAVPGLVARGTTTVVHAPNLGWHQVDLAQQLASLPPADRVEAPLNVDNEANLGAMAELWLGGHSAPLRDVIHVSAEIGIGAALIVDGELLRGTRGFGGEIGHMPVHPRGRVCGCGGRGCLEQYAGERAVLRAAGLEAGPGARLELLVSRAVDADAATLRALRDAGAALGIALAGAVNLLDPGHVVLGGALARVSPWLLPSLRRELSGRTTGQPTVLVSRLGPDGPLLGAAHTAVRAVLDDPLAPRH